MTGRTAIAVLSLVALARIAPAQVRDARPPAPIKGTAAITGRVVAADGGRPLRRVQIRATGAGQNRTTSTDEDGQYEVVDLPPGRYTVSATRAGFLPLNYGQRRPREIGRLVEVGDRQTAARINFALPGMSVIAGRITDEDGEPIAGVTVHTLRSAYFNGRRQLLRTSAPNVTTDDAGEYRISGLVPGSYAVVARTRDEWTVDDNGRPQTMGFMPTYFPGTTSMSDATRVTVKVGEEGRADFSLQPARAATLSGTALDSQGKPFPMVVLNLEVRSEGGGFFSSAGNTRTGPDGSFVLRNVAPGDYILRSSRQDPDPELARMPIVVDGTDLTNLALTGSSGGTVSGRVVLAASVAVPMPGMTINIRETLLGQPDPAMLGTFRDRYVPATPAADGTFTVAHVFGPARINVTLPDAWIVRSIVHEGRDITDAPIELRHGEQLSGLVITITNQVTLLSGTVASADGNAAPADGTIVVFPIDSQKWSDGSRFVRATRPDQQGRYEFKGLPAGDYQAIALDYVEDGAWNEPEYLRSLQARAQPVTLSLTEPSTLALTVAAQP